jgi:hypothetical protein
MNHIRLKEHYLGDMVVVETYDTDTGGIGGFVVKVRDLWHWLWTWRPCFVYRNDKCYRLR